MIKSLGANPAYVAMLGSERLDDVADVAKLSLVSESRVERQFSVDHTHLSGLPCGQENSESNEVQCQNYPGRHQGK
jgi:hypothetical protein